MKLRGLILVGLLTLGIGTVSAQDIPDPIGKRTPPKAAVSSGIDAAVLAEIVREVSGEDIDVVIDFINKIYDVKAKYKQVLQKEVELRNSHTSDEAQKKLMTEYIKLLHEEKEQAKAIIDILIRDLEAQELRLIQVMAKVFRVGDRMMKQTILNIRSEVKKFVHYQLINSQGTDRAFHVNVMRFLDQYFRA